MNPAHGRSHEQKNTLSNYRTADIALSAFLQARGHRILAIESEGGKGVFVFDDSENLRQDLLRWGNNEVVPIGARGFVNGLRDLKGLVGH